MNQTGVRVRLLYIDDDPALARLVEKDLSRHGYDVDWAADGDAGLQKLAENCYDICALDHYMPGREGLDVLPEIMALTAPPPVVYVTGAQDGRIAVSALRAGATDYVIKDVSADFTALLRSALDDALLRARLTEGGLADIDLGVTYYGYPGAQALDYAFLEFGAGISRSLPWLTAGVSAAYSPDFFAGSGQAWHYGLDLSAPVSLLTFNASVGHQQIELNEIFGTPDYTHWSLGIAIGLGGFEVSGAYLDSDVETARCFGGGGLCGGRAIVALSRAM